MKPKLRSLGGTWAKILALVAALVLGGRSRPANAQTLQDFGDAPAPFPTLLNNNGARHTIVSGFFLGQRVDGELDGQPNAAATGDDISPVGSANDEDGVTFLSLLVPGQTATVRVVASATGRLNAWIDFSGDGSWATAGDQIFTNVPLSAGANTLTFTVPAATARPGNPFARFRFNSQGGLSFVGAAADGEVEDYQVTISSPTDFGDAPSIYPTLLADNGARHVIDNTFFLGSKIDSETDGQPNAGATGDDINPSTANDEDGVSFTTSLVQGQAATAQVTCTIPTGQSGRLNAWIDFNGNGSWADAGEQISFNDIVVGGANTLNFTVPATAKTGQTYARFRLNRQGDLSYFGFAQEGEVEDYQVTINAPAQLDFGDAPDTPYPTFLRNNGARHVIDPTFYLGAKIDGEPDGQPNPTATGDDVNPSTSDDEDGVAFTSALVPGQVATVQVTCTIPTGQSGRLNAWIDFDGNGSWADAGEQIFPNVLVVGGVNSLTFNVPASAKPNQTYARFRLNRQGDLSYVGLAQDGEVEDYQVTISAPAQLDFGDAPDPPYPTTLKNNGAWHNIVQGFWVSTSARAWIRNRTASPTARPPAMTSIRRRRTTKTASSSPARSCPDEPPTCRSLPPRKAVT